MPTPRIQLSPVVAALKRPESVWILLSNAMPVFGVLFLGWGALSLLIFYWLENVFIGLVNVPKILLTGLTKSFPQNLLAVLLAPFFVVHYGLFCFVHGAFIFGLFAASDLWSGRAEPTQETFDVVGRVGAMLRDDADLRWSLIALAIVLLGRFAVLWLGRAAWRQTDPQRQMFEPYGRIIVLHMALFVCAIPVVALGQPAIGVFFLALFKTALELGLPQFQIGPRPTTVS